MASELERRARRAYEWGRLRGALGWTVPAVLFAGGSRVVGGVELAGALGGVLAVLLVGLRWRGGDLGRGVVPGLASGLLAWGVPLAWVCGDGPCVTACSPACLVVTGVAGGLGGLLLWRSVGSTSAVAALAIASVCASMGCLALGTGGLVGVAAVLVVGAPATLRAPVLA
ncbi:MAG: hypothetical protein R3F61_05885 [Myxococcota bacterium]